MIFVWMDSVLTLTEEWNANAPEIGFQLKMANAVWIREQKDVMIE